MKYLCILAAIATSNLAAQTPINKSIPVKAGQQVRMSFDYPELIKVSTWDKSEISIQGTVSINFGENDDAFEMENSESGNVVNIRSRIRDIKNLPRRYIVHREDGKKVIFKDKDEFRKHYAENRHYNSMSTGPDIDIQLEIKVPRNMETEIESVYGMVEIRSFSGPLTVEAKYGGVDAALNERMVGELLAETNYGQIYSNLDTEFGGDVLSQRDFHTIVSAKPGSGPRYDFESKYGNVYLRKEN
jgi:hypothetical protein